MDRWASAVLAVVALGASTAWPACSGEDDGPDALRPVVDQIAPAVEAVEARRGGAQQYFEINATPQLVNLFVAVDGATQVETYLYADGELADPTPAERAEGATFAADALTFDPDAVLSAVEERLPGSDIVNFSVVGGPGGAVQLGAIVQSGGGGTIDFTLAPDGSIQTFDPN